MEIKEQLDLIAGDIKLKNEELSKAIEGKASKHEIEEMKNSIEAKQTDLNAILIKQGEAITSLSERKTANEDTGSAILKGLQNAKENIDRIKSAKRGSLSFEIKNADRYKAIVTSAEIADNTLGYRVPNIGEIPYRRRFLEDLLGSGSVGDGTGNTIQYTDQANVTRAAGNIAEGGAYPVTTDIDWIEKSLRLEKIGDSIKVSRESMDDFDFVESEIRNLLLSSVDQRVDQQLLLGTGTTPQLKGIDISAGNFAAGSYATSIDDANLFDLIHVMKSQIMEAGQNMFNANAILMNPVDVTKLLSTKDSQGNYVIPPFATNNGRLVNGVEIVENTLVTAGQAYIMDSLKATVYNRKSLTFDISYDNEDDFNKDLVTIKASRRMALLIREVNNGAFIHVPDIAAAIAAITSI